MHCNGKTKTGAPCRAPAGPGGLCFLHANPDQARRLGQIGGRKNRSRLPELPTTGPVTAGDLRDTLSRAISDVQSNKITPRTAGAVSQLCNSLYRVLQTVDLEARLAKLEQQFAKQQVPTAVDTDPTRSGGQDQTGSGTGVQPRDEETAGNGGAGENDGSGED